jgi:protease-4
MIVSLEMLALRALSAAAEERLAGESTEAATRRRGRTAVVEVRGPIGLAGGPSVDSLRRALRGAAGADRIVLEIDSPGGLVDRVQALAAEIRELGPRVEALVDGGVAAGAALWLAAAASRITATRGSLLGGIGVASILRDSSRAAARAGVDVHVARSGPHKGIGTPGDRITLEQRLAEQDRVEQLGELFIEDLRQWRGLRPKQIAELRTGQTWLAGRARDLGLVDLIVGEDRAPAAASPRPRARARPVPAEAWQAAARRLRTDRLDRERWTSSPSYREFLVDLAWTGCAATRARFESRFDLMRRLDRAAR